MQIREITVTYGGKLNLGDYNSAHVEISITGVLNDGEDARAATAVLFDQAKAAVRDQAAPGTRCQHDPNHARPTPALQRLAGTRWQHLLRAGQSLRQSVSRSGVWSRRSAVALWHLVQSQAAR